MYFLSYSKLFALPKNCLLYTSDAADERSSVDLGGRGIIKKKKHIDSGDSMIDTVQGELISSDRKDYDESDILVIVHR